MPRFSASAVSFLLATTFSVAVAPTPVSAAVDLGLVRAMPTTVAAGEAHTVFLDGNGRPYAFGNNSNGQLTGVGDSAVPRVMEGLPEGVTGVSVAAGFYASLVIGSDGMVYAAGSGGSGQLTGSSDRDTLTPMTGLPEGVKAVDAATSRLRSIVLGDDGVLYGTGSGAFGALPGVGSATTLTAMSPLPDGDEAVRVAVGNHNFAVIARDGSIYGSGYNGSGQLTGSANPVVGWAEFSGLPSGYRAVGIAMGAEHSAVLLDDGSIWSSGSNALRAFGLEGPGSTTPVQAPDAPTAVGVATASGTAFATLALGSDGITYGAGHNVGQMGDLPTPVSPFTAIGEASPIGTITELAVGNNHSVAHDSDGVLYGIGSYTGSGVVPALTVVAGQPIVATSPVTVTGDPHVGSTLTASSATWAPNTGTSTFQWLRDGEVIPSATAPTYEPTVADRGSRLSVTETRTRATFLTGTSTSSATATITDPPLIRTGGTLTVTGTAQVGGTLTGSDTTTWNAEPETRTYRWVRDGTPVTAPAATPGSYELAADDAGTVITLALVTTRSDYLDATIASAGVGPVANGTLGVEGALTISGTAKVGEVLRATAQPSFGPGPATVSYRWTRDGTPVGSVSATPTDYTLTAADAGSVLRLTATGSRAGYDPRTVLSNPIGPVGPGAFEATGSLEVSGNPTVGSVVTVDGVPSFTPTPDSVSYQWMRDGQPVGPATSTPSSYELASADEATTISLTVTAERLGYTDAQATSNSIGPVAPGILTVPQATISGTGRVGSVLTDTTASSTPNSVPTRQWLRDGVPIAGATATTYRLTTADAGRLISLRVSFARPGYMAQERTATAVPVAALNTAKPVVSGTPRVGKRLSATVGRWSAPGHSFTYQWLRNGKAIPRATSARYRATKADRKKSLSVRVTARRSGFPLVLATSAARKVR